jgi:hypothetical protein
VRGKQWFGAYDLVLAARFFVRVRVMSKPVQAKPASEPDLRQIKPVVVAGFITIGSSSPSPDAAKRNPGTINKLQCRPGFHPAYEEIKGSGTP